MPDPSEAVQDYLKAIHRLGGAERIVSPADIVPFEFECVGNGDALTQTSLIEGVFRCFGHLDDAPENVTRIRGAKDV